MPFPSKPLRFVVHTHVSGDTIAFRPSQLLVRYFPIDGEASAVPRVLSGGGLREINEEWWEIENLRADGDARLFRVRFKGDLFSAALTTDPCGSPKNRSLYEAILDQDTIELAVDMGTIPVECAPGQFEDIRYVASLLLSLHSEH